MNVLSCACLLEIFQRKFPVLSITAILHHLVVRLVSMIAGYHILWEPDSPIPIALNLATSLMLYSKVFPANTH